MRVAVDIDGVLYDWDGTARHMLRRYLSEMEKPAIPGLLEPSRYWSSIRDMVGNEAWDWLWSHGVKQGLFRNGHIIKGALDSLRILAKRHEVILVTSRPKNAVMDTLEWVSFMLRGVDISGVHVLHQQQAKTTIPFDVLIDDGLHNIEDALDDERKAVLFSQPWNQDGLILLEDAGHVEVMRVAGWGEVLEIL